MSLAIIYFVFSRLFLAFDFTGVISCFSILLLDVYFASFVSGLYCIVFYLIATAGCFTNTTDCCFVIATVGIYCFDTTADVCLATTTVDGFVTTTAGY